MILTIRPSPWPPSPKFALSGMLFDEAQQKLMPSAGVPVPSAMRMPKVAVKALTGALVLKSGIMKAPCWPPALSVRCNTPEPPTPLEQSIYALPLRKVSTGGRQSLKLYVMIGLLAVIGASTLSNALLLVVLPLGPLALTRNFAPLSARVVAGVVYAEEVAPGMLVNDPPTDCCCHW